MPSLTGGYSANEAREITRRLMEMQANMNGGGGAGGGGVGQQQQSTKDYLSREKTYYSDPALAGGAGQALGRTIDEQSQGYSQFVDNPTASPAYQNALSGMLAALVPGEQEGRRDLADMFRAAGNTASSSFGEAANKYQQGVDRNRMSVASDLLAKLYPQIAGAKFAPLSQTASLLDALKLQQSQTQSHEQSTSNPVNFGGGAPGGLAAGPMGAQLGASGGGGASMFPAPQLPPSPNWASSPGPLFSSPGGPRDRYGAGF